MTKLPVGKAAVIGALALFLGGLLGVGCGPSDEQVAAENRVRELEQQLTDANTAREGLDRRLAEMTNTNAAMTERLRALGQNVEGLQSDLDRTQRALTELQERERQAQARLATFRQMIERFRAMIASGRLRVRIVRGRMVVELPDNILFESGEAELKDAGETALGEIVEVLKTIPGREFQVAGHTDNVPIRSRRFPSNWELSTSRAVAVAKFMIERGLEGSRVSAAGHAETAPVASNDTPEGRQQNRRIEIILLPNLDELPDLSSLEGSQPTATAPTPAPVPAAAPR
jgi:chemotaxis protein MotB